jgi:hypothetical protein
MSKRKGSTLSRLRSERDLRTVDVDAVAADAHQRAQVAATAVLSAAQYGDSRENLRAVWRNHAVERRVYISAVSQQLLLLIGKSTFSRSALPLLRCHISEGNNRVH